MTVRGRRTVANQQVGRLVCRVGIASGKGCGTISRKPSSVTLSDGTTLKGAHLVEMKLASQEGDSGAGMYSEIYSYPDNYFEAQGILSAGDSRDGVAYTYYFGWDRGIIHTMDPNGDYWVVRPCVSSTCPLN
jgi:hypothetical protein